MSTFDTVKNQFSGAAKNLATGVQAGIQSQTSIVGRASVLLGKTVSAAAARKTAGGQSKRQSGVYILTDEEARARDLTGGTVYTAPDGYIRKTPIQHTMVAPDYTARLIKQIVKWVIIAAVVVAALYLLSRLNIIHF